VKFKIKNELIFKGFEFRLPEVKKYIYDRQISTVGFQHVAKIIEG
jgi:hypothetical protein